jgi:PDDEXK-like domain of unknown function (DUF3799)
MTELIVTKPGLYQMDEATYHGDPVPEGSLSCSGAKLLLPPSCPAKYAWARKHPPEPKPHLEFGSAAHREVLGTGWPFDVWDGDAWRSNAAKDFAAASRLAGRIPILAPQREQITEMAAAIRAHPTASVLLGADEVMNEMSLFWLDEQFGIWRRARMDAVRLGGRVVIVDYKTTVCADPEEFARSAGRYGYHWQDAWYKEAVTCVLGDADPLFLFVAQEKEAPYLTGIYELDGDSVAYGRGRVESACREYARCVAAGEWPGYQLPDETVTKISIPRWSL